MRDINKYLIIELSGIICETIVFLWVKIFIFFLKTLINNSHKISSNAFSCLQLSKSKLIYKFTFDWISFCREMAQKFEIKFI